MSVFSASVSVLGLLEAHVEAEGEAGSEGDVAEGVDEEASSPLC